MAADYDLAITALDQLKRQELSIIRLSEPLSSAAPNVPKRSSDASTDGTDNPSPASLAADLAHYKELFSKLRFSYLEQVTKEKFLRAIVGDPPQVVEHAENVELERQLAAAKKELKAQKEIVNSIVDDIEIRGNDLSQRYEAVELRSIQLQYLPSEIASLDKSLASLRITTNTSQDSNPALNLPLTDTTNLLAQKRTELDALDRKLKGLQQGIPRKSREAERLESELKPLEIQRAGIVAAANEARTRKEQGERGVGDELELKGRWYRSVEAGIIDLVGNGA